MEAVHVLVRNSGKDRDDSGQDGAIEKRYNGGLFNGLLVCTDPDGLRTALLTGIGSAKAFGFGLLSLAPAPGNAPGPGSSAPAVR